MAIKLKALPFASTDLEPYISKSTLEYHYGKHHKGYVDTLNKLISGTFYDGLSLDEILLEASDNYEIDKKIYNNAGQAWNHEFYWDCLTGDGFDKPSHDFLQVLREHFKSFEDFKSDFKKAANELFGSGWVWLVKTKNGNLKIESLEKAGNPLTHSNIPLLACDVWEHAYYLDYQNERKGYVENFWNIINWEFVEANYERGSVIEPWMKKSHYGEEYSSHPDKN